MPGKLFKITMKPNWFVVPEHVLHKIEELFPKEDIEKVEVIDDCTGAGIDEGTGKGVKTVGSLGGVSEGD